MPKVEAPVGDAKLDSNDIPGSAVSIITSVLGVGLMFAVIAYGRDVGNFIQNFVGGVTGIESNESGPSIEVV